MHNLVVQSFQAKVHEPVFSLAFGTIDRNFVQHKLFNSKCSQLRLWSVNVRYIQSDSKTASIQELNETRTRTEIQMEEVDGRVSRDYESRLAEALRQMREDYEYQIRTTREETEEVWLNKVRAIPLKNEAP